jgi:hypothetical protein
MADDISRDNPQYQDPQGDLDVPEQPMPGDYGQTPAAPAQTPDDRNFPADHPTTDAEVDETEAYDAGLATASGNTDQEVDQEPDQHRVA